MSVPAAIGLQTQINKLVYNNNGLGTYSFEFETSDGTYRRENGGMVPKPEGDGLVVRGEYGYIDPQGRHYTVRYIADANGFQPLNDIEDTRFNDRNIV
ncbi:endocuticle structural glycoprotein ABD-5-like isoform X2 [Pectinophora gossypiella]|nr:endocuticle structural glycoprotein ABD-5-like isoform X2 [Pectinophora gossypiella]